MWIDLVYSVFLPAKGTLLAHDLKFMCKQMNGISAKNIPIL